MPKRENRARMFARISLLTLNIFASSDKLLNFAFITVSFKELIPKCLDTIKVQLFSEKLLFFLLYLRVGNFSDNRLLPFLTDPYGHLDMLCRYPILVGMDFSVKPEMPIPMKIAVSFYNKLLMAWWHYNGKTVIPNIVVDKDIIEYCLDGYPKGSVVAMNSSGIGRDERAKSNWQIIYPQVINVLQPIRILRYGAKQQNEREDISVYYDNDNMKFRNYGW